MNQAQPSKFEGHRSFYVGDYEYLSTFFESRMQGTGNSFIVADQFTQFLEHYGKLGFEFFRCDDVPYHVTPGCIAGLFGAKEQFGHSTIVTFRKKVK